MNSIPGENRELDALVNQPKETHKGVTCLALTFGTLLSSQGADARDTWPAGPSIAAAVPRYAALCRRQAAGQGPALGALGAAVPGATSVPRAVFRGPLSCWVGGAWSDLRAVTRSPSRSGLAGRGEEVTWVSSGLSNRSVVTRDTCPERGRHTPFTRFRRAGPRPPSACRGAAPASPRAASRTPPARRRRR
jgi:hypothetical protein